MQDIEIQQKLRPIRLLFLVSPNNLSNMQKIMELNSVLWGGFFNPILPVYRRLPNKLKRGFANYNAQQYVTKYLEIFDPDFVVMTDKSHGDLDLGNYSTIQYQDINKPFIKTSLPNYAIGVYEILNYFIHNEMRYKRENPLLVDFPDFESNKDVLFLSSVFGKLPNHVKQNLKKWPQENISFSSVDIRQYVSLLQDKNRVFPRHLMKYKLKLDTLDKPYPNACLYLLDHRNTLDIVHYWNMRARGYKVLPLPINQANNKQVMRFVKRFVKEQYYTTRGGSKHRAFLCAGTSVPSECSTKILECILPSSNARNDTLIPRGCNVLEHILRDPEHKTLGIYHTTKSQRVTGRPDEKALEVRFRALIPEFIEKDNLDDNRFANEVAYQLPYDDFRYAPLLPKSADQSMKYLIFATDKWRVCQESLVVYPRYFDIDLHFKIPSHLNVFSALMQHAGWGNLKLSTPGMLATKMIEQLGGPWHLQTLTAPGLLEFLDSISGKTKSWEEVQEALNRMDASLTNDVLSSFDKEQFLEHLVNKKILELVVEIQCIVCSRRSTYTFDELNKTIACRYCLTDFNIPMHNPNNTFKWRYKSVGTFSVGDMAGGAFTVLLVRRFFERALSLYASVAFIPSFECHKSGEHEGVEVDGAILCSKEGFNRSIIADHLIFLEAKSHLNFEQKDTDRMKALGLSFPHATLVFASLKEALSSEEKTVLADLVKAQGGRRGYTDWSNRVVILTSTELLALHDLRRAWKNKGGEHAEYAQYHLSLADLCQRTQQLYL